MYSNKAYNITWKDGMIAIVEEFPCFLFRKAIEKSDIYKTKCLSEIFVNL